MHIYGILYICYTIYRYSIYTMYMHTHTPRYVIIRYHNIEYTHTSLYLMDIGLESYFSIQMRWFLIHLLPPLVGTAIVLRVVRHDPSKIVNALPSLIPGLTEPKLLRSSRNHQLAWQLTFHSEVMNVFAAIRATQFALTANAKERATRATLAAGQPFSREEESTVPKSPISSGRDTPEFRNQSPREGTPPTPSSPSARSDPWKNRLPDGKSKAILRTESGTETKPSVQFKGALSQRLSEIDQELCASFHRSCYSLINNPDVQPKERVIINFVRMWRLSIIPVLFCMYYFWDGAIIRKYVSKDFPLSHCHAEYHCFYTKDFSFFTSNYVPLKCGELREESVESGHFKFLLPPDAEFFECYELAFTVTSAIQYACDCFSLFVFFALLTTYFMVTRVKHSEETNESEAEDFKSFLDMTSQELIDGGADSANVHSPQSLALLDQRIRYYRRCEVLCLVALLGTLIVVANLMGTVFTTTGSCVVLPSAALYMFFLLDLKRESLQDYKLTLDLETVESDERSPLCCASTEVGDTLRYDTIIMGGNYALMSPRMMEPDASTDHIVI
eukprot:GEMP01020597.1.p1 GENE.GEMP01020597.1~~GEMP01020597.1.p1  ORF type:complete len:559 (+),score=55.25 GEMP01020597.1:24-1700(+)